MYSYGSASYGGVVDEGLAPLILSESVSINEGINFGRGVIFSDSLSASCGMSTLKVSYKEIADSLSIRDKTDRATDILLEESLEISEIFIRFREKEFSASLSVGDTATARIAGRKMEDSVSVGANARAYMNGVRVGIWERVASTTASWVKAAQSAVTWIRTNTPF